MIYHPDKNTGCEEQASEKFKILNKLCDGESVTKDINEYNKTYKPSAYYSMMPKPTFTTSQKSTEKVRTYFSQLEYYYMLNELFQNMTREEQILMKKVFLTPIRLDPTKYSNIDSNAYATMINNVTVEKNSGTGDCFFIALADALNLYNSFYQDTYEERIVYQQYGKTAIFTQKSLRTLVENAILQPVKVDDYVTLGELNAENLNDLFQEALKTREKDQPIDEIIENIYKSNDNFLVKKPEPNTSLEKVKPFKSTSQDEIRDYVESPYYWADNTTIEIIIEQLKLNVIVIENVKGQLRVPFANLKIDKILDWNKYVFLYYENQHYELMTFTYQLSKTFVKRSIFKNNVTVVPAIYLIFLLFSVYYIQLSELEQQNVAFFRKYLEAFLKSFEAIYQKTTTTSSEKTRFFKDFNTFFNTNSKSMLNQKYPLINGTNQNLKGGAYKEESMLSYYITIELELKKGDTISKEDMKKIKCRTKWNAVRKSYAKFTKKKYVIPPVYENSKTSKTLKNRKP